jgi:hypothetical protein
MSLGIQVKCQIFLLEFSQIWNLAKFGFSRHILIEVSDIKLYENPSSGSLVAREDRRTDTRV